MAEELDDGEFWLPSQFLTDDDIPVDFKSENRDTRTQRPDTGVVYYGTYSGLSSPVSSTETESDEEYYLAGLTRKMANSTLQNHSGFCYHNHKNWPSSGSPQSTLCGVISGCGCKQGWSRGSRNCPSRVTSPPAAANQYDGGARDLLYAAAGEVARMRVVEEDGSSGPSGCFQNRRPGVGPPRKPSPVPFSSVETPIPIPIPIPNPDLGFHSNHSLSYAQLQLAQFQQLKRQQMMKQHQVWGHSNSGGFQQNQTHQVVHNRARNNARRPLGLSPSDWPTLQQSYQQQQPNSGMRAVFLANNGPKRQCTGTGVFLPRQISTQTQSLKRPGSTVFVPERMVHALNLNLDAMDDAQYSHKSQYNNGSFTPDYDSALKFRNDVSTAHQKRNIRTRPAMNQELSTSGVDLLTQPSFLNSQGRY